jgi:FkbM family methyltransferase
MYVDLRSGIGRALFMKGIFDPVVFEALKDQLIPGATFIDIGANVGYYSVLASRMVGSKGAVHCFEIDPRPLLCLRRNASRGPLRNIYVHELAVGDREGEALLRQEEESGNSSVHASGSGHRIALTTLDTWQESQPSLGQITAIKVDIEGGELLALRGARELMARHQPTIVCECCLQLQERAGYGPGELLQFFEGAGYQVESLEGVWTPTLVARPRKES